jgi:hypothetical protein
MAKTEKIYKLKKSSFGRSGSDRETIIEGTLDYLIQYFSYTLEIGNSWNKKIDRNPKTIKSFMKNLVASLEEKEGACYTRTLIELVE